MRRIVRDDYLHLRGYRFPGGRFTLSPHTSWLWADCVGAEPDAALAHPSIGYLVGLCGCGLNIQDVFALMDADADSGILFGECELSFKRMLVPGTDYDVTGEIVSVERKVGRRAGAFDLLTFRIDVCDPEGGGPVCSSTNTWVFPRAGA